MVVGRDARAIGAGGVQGEDGGGRDDGMCWAEDGAREKRCGWWWAEGAAGVGGQVPFVEGAGTVLGAFGHLGVGSFGGLWRSRRAHSPKSNKLEGA